MNLKSASIEILYIYCKANHSAQTVFCPTQFASVFLASSDTMKHHAYSRNVQAMLDFLFAPAPTGQGPLNTP